jgi:hypothetical protein
MRRHVPLLLALFALLAFAVVAHARLGTATGGPGDHAARPAPPTLDGAPTKFDLIFGGHDLALP